MENSENNKIIRIIIISILAFSVLMIYMKNNDNDVTAPVVTEEPANSKICYSYIQEATEAAPYSVEEHIVLNFEGENVTGTKEGTQFGPDMSNGYSGNLEGTRNENNLELLFAYTIEGSDNKELELYELRGENMIKKRYPLEAIQEVLTPITTGELKEMVYQKEPCQI